MNRFGKSLLGLGVLLFIGVVALASPADKLQPEDDMLMKQHAEANITCEQCHGENVPKKTDAKKDFRNIATAEACLKCHGSYQQIAEATRNYQPPYNPHYSHFDNLDCYVCHREHQTSEMFCNSCHLELKVPATGWKVAGNPADEE